MTISDRLSPDQIARDDAHMPRPEVIARECGYIVPKQNKAFSWFQLCELIGDRYEENKRLRQQGDAA